MSLKKKIVLFLTVFLLVFNTIGVQAASNKNKDKDKDDDYKGKYTDVKDGYWAKEAIELMDRYGIINGFKDNTFRPNVEVTRAEFAKMMVLTLDLKLENPNKGSFLDVKNYDWSYKYVETAKPYLTGFKTDQGLYFKPNVYAIREEMAVAIVKGLGIDADKTDMSVLNSIKDEAKISKNLRKYVAAAINEGIMIGDSNKYFGPDVTLTRAEAATLLARLITEEKVTFDETKVVIGDTNLPDLSKTLVLSAKIDNNEVDLSWSGVEDKNFAYYMVVISKSNSKPTYPKDGYIAYITDKSKNSFTLRAGLEYINGDFTKLISGQTYYVSISAIYQNGTKYYSSNALAITIP